MDRRSFLTTTTLGAATLGFPAVLRAQSKDPIRIGVPLPLTGPFGALAADMQRGAQLAEVELNAKGGILGRKVEVLFRDDQLKPAVGAQRTQELIEKEKCQFIVGGLAAAVFGYLWARYEPRPRFIVVEPEQADCLLQSARNGRASRATGSVDSVMAGLACGETSPLAWRFLQPSVDVFMTVSDDDAVSAMRVLATGDAGDVPVVSGESGAAGLAALTALAGDAEGRRQAALDASSHVLLVNTEGATAPALFRTLTGLDADEVRSAQARWRA